MSTDTAARPRIATCSLAGCFGCHMSILDIDERILQLAEVVEFDFDSVSLSHPFGLDDTAEHDDPVGGNAPAA